MGPAQCLRPRSGPSVACSWILVALVLKRLSELDSKLDKYIDESASVRGDVMMLKDRWDYYWRRPSV